MKRQAILAAILALMISATANAQSTSPAITSAWTSATAIDTTTEITVLLYSSVRVSLEGTGTLTAGTLQFEATDSFASTAAWTPVAMVRDADGLSEANFPITAAGKQVWSRPIAGYVRFRVRLNPAITGSGTVNLSLRAAAGVAAMRAFSLGRPVRCVFTTTATTSTSLAGECAAPPAGFAIFITDVSVYGGVAVGATAAATIQSGTGGTCGTATRIHYYCQHTATAGCEHTFVTPSRAVTAGEVCILDATVGTKFVTINGVIAPSP